MTDNAIYVVCATAFALCAMVCSLLHFKYKQRVYWHDVFRGR